MALARMSLRNLKQNQRWNKDVLKRFMATNTGGDQQAKQGGKEVSVSEKKSSRLFPRRRGRRNPWLTCSDRHFPPGFYDFFPSGLGNALMEATENINRLFDNLNITAPPLHSQGVRVKEQDDCYKLRYEVPGLTKDDVKITVADGILTIKGERSAEEDENASPEDEDEDEGGWSSAKRYGHYYYNTRMALPEDAKVEEIKAELKDGVIAVVIPRIQNLKKDVKEIAVH